MGPLAARRLKYFKVRRDALQISQRDNQNSFILNIQAMVYLFQMLYLQDLVEQKLQKESHLRNLIAHMALSKRLHEMQMDYDAEICVPAGKESESFAEFLARNQPGATTSSSTTSVSNLCEQYEAITLHDSWDEKEAS